MKFENICPHNLRQLVPVWTADYFEVAKLLDEHLTKTYDAAPKLRPKRWDIRLRFWIEMTLSSDGFWSISSCEPSGSISQKGKLILFANGESISLPLNAVLKGSSSLDGSHCVYAHTVMSECPMMYIGISKQKWFERWAQHSSAANAGSNLVFHSALRHHGDKPVHHIVLLAGVNFDTAMHYEEEFVREMSLYPRGLNMIPGGFAGLKYLHKLGIQAKTAEDRDIQLEGLAANENLGGKPNPLCAARWQSDQDYINRVICGHSSRLSVSQVRAIRMAVSFGAQVAEAAIQAGTTKQKAKLVAEGKIYGRVA